MSTKAPLKPLIWIICPETLRRHGCSIHDVPTIFSGLSKQDQKQIMLLYRNKTVPNQEAYKTLKWLRDHLQTPEKDLMTYGPSTWVQDLNLAGLHLPDASNIQHIRESLGENSLLGISRHTNTFTNTEGKEGADYVFMSPVFSPISKTIKEHPIPHAELAELCSAAKIPVIALGGISLKNVCIAQQTGFKGAAFIGTVFTTSQPRRQLEGLCLNWKKASD